MTQTLRMSLWFTLNGGQLSLWIVKDYTYSNHWKISWTCLEHKAIGIFGKEGWKKVCFETQELQQGVKEDEREAQLPPQSTKIYQAILSVAENMMQYTKEQIKRAGCARVTYQTLGSLTIENFKMYSDRTWSRTAQSLLKTIGEK